MTVYTPIARLPVMTPADPAVKDAWGLIINAALAAVEQTAAGYASIDLTGLTDYTLLVANDAPDQARQAMLLFVGAPGGSCAVTIPSVARIGWVSNRSNNTVVLGTMGGTVNLTVPAGSSFLYQCDGAATSAVAIGAGVVLNAALGVSVNNAAAYSANDVNGTLRPLLKIGADNWTDLYVGGAAGWRVLAQDGTTTLFSIGGASGAVSIPGPASFAKPVTFNAVTTGAGLIAAGGDSGGLNLRLPSATYGSGWRNDGVGTYLLLTAAGAPLGTFNALRPFTVDNATGKVTLDATGTGGVVIGGKVTLDPTGAGGVVIGGAVTAAGRQTASDLVLTAGGTHLPNAAAVYWKDNANVDRAVIQLDGANNVNHFVGGAANWRVLNQSGAVTLFTITNAGAAAFAGAVSTPGNLVGGGIIATNGNIAGALAAGTVAASGAMFATAFNVTSDNRAKSDVQEISADQAWAWINLGRPVTYQMDGRSSAGFLAQDDIWYGRGDAVDSVDDDDPRFAESDGVAAAGQRLTRNYDHDVAYLTAALQDALLRIVALEEARCHQVAPG